jgi:hypothetical protein
MELERCEREPTGAFQGNRFLVHTSALMSMLDVLGRGVSIPSGTLPCPDGVNVEFIVVQAE